MKKTLRVFGIIAVVICLILSIVACDKKGDESIDVIAVSESEYASVEDALKGYVKEELAFVATYDDGEKVEYVKAEYVSNESKGEVAIDKIKLSDTQKTNLLSAEEFAVKAKVAMARNKVEDEEFSDVTQTAYVLKYGEKYKYMVSTPEEGERLTNSYVEIFTDATKYENCTLTAISMEKEEEDEKPVFYAANEFKLTAEVGYAVKYYNETRFNNRTPGNGENTCDRVNYFVMKGDKVAMVGNRISNDKEVWTAEYLNEMYYKNINSVKDYNKYLIQLSVLSMFIETPAALFTKTANGFEFKIEEVDNYGDKEIYEIRFIVSDGKISELYRKEASEWTYEEEGETYVESYETEIKIKDFGTTSAVSLPDVVTEALSELA